LRVDPFPGQLYVQPCQQGRGQSRHQHLQVLWKLPPEPHSDSCLNRSLKEFPLKSHRHAVTATSGSVGSRIWRASPIQHFRKAEWPQEIHMYAQMI